MLTLLKTDEQPGLQIWLDGRFVDVPPRSGTFIVNLGDMLERCNMAVLSGMVTCKTCLAQYAASRGCPCRPQSHALLHL